MHWDFRSMPSLGRHTLLFPFYLKKFQPNLSTMSGEIENRLEYEESALRFDKAGNKAVKCGAVECPQSSETGFE